MIPNPPRHTPLRFSTPEVEAAVDGFDSHRIFQGKEATPEAVAAALPDYPVYHFSCHGFAVFGEAQRSGLLMAGRRLPNGDVQDQFLTLGDFYKLHLDPGARLAVLSACETGIPADLDLPDEVSSLPTGLLQAGVAGVAASLWSVADLSTMMLMAMFYEYWRVAGHGPGGGAAAGAAVGARHQQ